MQHNTIDAKLNNKESDFNPSRRQALKIGAMAPAALAALNLTSTFNNAQAATSSLGSKPTTPWLDKLVVLPVAVPVIDTTKGGSLADSAYFTKYPVSALDHQNGVLNEFPPKKYYHHRYTENTKYKFHSEYPENTVWGWENNFGGPTFKVRYGEPVMVRRTNCLDPNHVGVGNPTVSTHLHNAHTPAESDGNPLGDYQVNPGSYKDYHYPNVYAGYSLNQHLDPVTKKPWEAQSTLWYHDHMLDYTSQNVYMGLAGFYLMFNEYDTDDETGATFPATNFRLPSGNFDIPLIFIDMKFDAAGYRVFDTLNLDGMLGDKITVNGKIQPYHEVGNRKYRLRLLNSGPSRFYTFSFSNKMSFQVVGIDGNLLPAPLSMTSITLAPAERADIIVNFSTVGLGKTVYLQNTLEQVDGRGPKGTMTVPDLLLRFDVKIDIAKPNALAPYLGDPSKVPTAFYPLPTIPAAKKALSGLTSLKTKTNADRTFLFDRSNGAWTVNGKIYDPLTVSAIIPLNAEEVWEIQGSGNWAHPVHIHFEEFQILSRNGVAPPAQEKGRKDVIYLRPGEKVRIFMRFRDFHGRFVMHCHNVVHEDHAMMVNWIVGEADPVDNVGGICWGIELDQADYDAVYSGALK